MVITATTISMGPSMHGHLVDLHLEKYCEDESLRGQQMGALGVEG